MKTLKGWEASLVDLDNYLNEPCEIDEDLHNYIAECVCPVYIDQNFIQGGDCIKCEDLIDFYMTTSSINNKFFYLGVLPEFKQ